MRLDLTDNQRNRRIEVQRLGMTQAIVRFSRVLGVFAVSSLALLVSDAAAQGAAPTFTKDVAPVLYKHCTVCHRAGEDRADVAADLRGSAPVGPLHSREGS